METEENKPPLRMKRLIPLALILAAIAIFFYLKGNDGPSQSQVDGVSDEVYEELIQWYFFVKISMEYIVDSDLQTAVTWYEDHALYETAEKYATEQGDGFLPIDFFPNRLLWEHMKHQDQFSKNEQTYIQKMNQFVNALSGQDVETYDKLQNELKESLKIKESYNPFE